MFFLKNVEFIFLNVRVCVLLGNRQGFCAVNLLSRAVSDCA